MRSILIFLLVAAMSTSTAADESFAVDSYIPEWFEDWQARISGGMSFYGSSQNRGEHLERDESVVQTSFTSEVEYRNITRDRDLDFRGYLDGGWKAEQTDSDNDGTYSIGEASSSTDATEYSVSVLLDPSVRQYLISDFFGRLNMRVFFSYRDEPNSALVSNSERVTNYTDSTLRRVTISNESSKDVRRSLDIRVSSSFGYGRVYVGRFAFTALSMVDQLKSHGLTIRELTNQEYQQLADTIFAYRNSFVFDDRYHEIQALESIMDYLRSIGVVDVDPGLGAILVSDVWNYYPYDNRQFGFLVQAGYGFDYYQRESSGASLEDLYVLNTIIRESAPGSLDTSLFVDDVFSSGIDEDYERFLPFLSARIGYFKPLSIHWQLDFEVELQYFLNAYDIRESRYFPELQYDRTETRDEPFWSIWGEWTVAYFTDRRTRVDLSVQSRYRKRDETRTVYRYVSDSLVFASSGGERTITDDFSLAIQAEVSYRIAPPTSINFSSVYRYDNDQGRVWQRFSAGIGLTHYIY